MAAVSGWGFFEGLGPQIWILPEEYPHSEQVWRNGWEQIIHLLRSKTFLISFYKKVSLFFWAKNLLKHIIPFNQFFETPAVSPKIPQGF